MRAGRTVGFSSLNGPSRSRALAFSAIPLLTLLALGEAVLRLIDPAWMGCVRTYACPAADGNPQFITEQKHNFTLESREPLLVFDPVLLWWARPHVRGTVWSTPGVRTNAFGLRDTTVDTNPRTPKVLLVGDSIVWGSLVEEHQRFGNVAARLLRADPRFEDVRIVNAGMVGFSSRQVLRFLDARGFKAFTPRVVVVCAGVNDAWEVSRSDSAEEAYLTRRATRLRHALRRSNLFLFLERYVTEGVAWLRTGSNPRGISFLYGVDGSSVRVLRNTPSQTEANFARIGRLARAHRASLLLILPTTRTEHPRGWDEEAFLEARTRVGALAAREGWPCIDVARLASLPWPGPEDHLRDFCHLSPAGHRVVGRWLAEELMRLLGGAPRG